MASVQCTYASRVALVQCTQETRKVAQDGVARNICRSETEMANIDFTAWFHVPCSFLVDPLTEYSFSTRTLYKIMLTVVTG